MKDAVETNTLLALPDEATVANAFASAETLTALLDVIAKECRAEVLTAETVDGRDRIKSLAYKIARSKTTIDNIGKGLTEEARKLQTEINARRGIAEKFLTSLKDEMRMPLTKWEEAEDARKQAHKDRMGVFSPTALPVSSAALSALAMQIEAIAIDDSWEEFTTDAATAKANCLRHLGMKIADAVLEEEREAELQRLRAAEAERKAQAEQELIEAAQREAGLRQEREEAEATALAAKRASDAQIAALKAEQEEIEQRARDAKAEADAKEAAAAAEIEALRAQLAAANAPKPEPIPEPVAEATPEPVAEYATGGTVAPGLYLVAEPATEEAGALIQTENSELAATEAAIRAAVLSIIANCFTADATAAEVASAIMLGEIPHVKVVL